MTFVSFGFTHDMPCGNLVRLGRIGYCRFFLPDVGKRFQLQSLFNERHLIADTDLPTGATRDHRHGKGRVLLADIMSQCG